MSFDRHRFQLAIEYIVSCDQEELYRDKSKIQNFKKLTLSRDNCDILIPELVEDSRDFYFKGALSFFEAVLGLTQKRYSWSIVKAYYSIFYFCRCILAADDIGLFRAKSIFALRLEEFQTPSAQSASGDHKAVLSLFRKTYPNSKFFSNSIIFEDEQFSGLEYLMHMREIVHYKSRCFDEPHSRYFDESISGSKEIERYLNIYINDKDFVYCFLKEHSILAYPIKMMIEASMQIRERVAEGILSAEKKSFLHRLRAQGNISIRADINNLIES